MRRRRLVGEGARLHHPDGLYVLGGRHLRRHGINQLRYRILLRCWPMLGRQSVRSGSFTRHGHLLERGCRQPCQCHRQRDMPLGRALPRWRRRRAHLSQHKSCGCEPHVDERVRRPRYMDYPSHMSLDQPVRRYRRIWWDPGLHQPARRRELLVEDRRGWIDHNLGVVLHVGGRVRRGRREWKDPLLVGPDKRVLDADGCGRVDDHLGFELPVVHALCGDGPSRKRAHVYVTWLPSELEDDGTARRWHRCLGLSEPRPLLRR